MPKPAARKTLTEKGIAALKPVPGKRVHVFDSVVPGLAVRVTENGVKTFVLVTRYRGKQIWVTLGRVGAIKDGLAGARDLARDKIAMAMRGEDPRQKPEPLPDPDLFKKLAEDFIEKYAKPRQRRWDETERILKTYVLPVWGKREAKAITRRDVIDLIEGMADTGYMANRTLACIRRLFGWAVERDAVPFNPAAGVRPIGKEEARDRVLSDAELRAFWRAVNGMGWPWGAFFKVLALTAQRREEVASMRWQDLHLDADKPVWTLPKEATKAGRVHDVPLAPEVVAILKELPRFADPKDPSLGVYVFTTNSGRNHVRGYSGAKERLDKAMLAELRKEAEEAGGNPPEQMETWRNHDLRRTAASTWAKFGTPPHVVSRILNHTPGRNEGITAVYNRHSYSDERRRALEMWAGHLVGLTADRPANVVALRAGAANG